RGQATWLGTRVYPLPQRFQAIGERHFALLALVFLLDGFPDRRCEAFAFQLGEFSDRLVGRRVPDVECHIFPDLDSWIFESRLGRSALGVKGWASKDRASLTQRER